MGHIRIYSAGHVQRRQYAAADVLRDDVHADIALWAHLNTATFNVVRGKQLSQHF